MSASLTSGTHPRAGARSVFLGSVASSFARWGGLLWRGLSAFGRARARAQLTALVQQYEHTDPALARQMRLSLASLDHV